jgi:P4 family phage/plasmid primase-like protien
MSEAEVMGEEYRETRDYFLNKIDDKQLSNLLESTTAAKIADESFIDGLKTAYPNYEGDLKALHEEVKELQDQEQEAYDWTKYFEETNKGGNKFQPKWLADDIEKDYSFKKIKDSEELYVFSDGYYQPKGQQTIREEAEKRLNQEYRDRRVREVISIIESRNYISRRDFRPPKRKINLENGVYDLQKEELIDHSPDYFFTYKINTRYDPTQDCPRINQFLEEIVETEQEVKTLREIAGYMLLPDYPIPKAFMLLGKGNNGKSRYLDLLRNLIGDQNVVEKGLQDLDGRFGTHELHGKIGCIDDDLSSTKISEEAAGTMKKLTGGSRIGAEVKYGGHYNFYNYAKLVFSANELPRTSDDTDGFYRRWILVEFPYKFMETPDASDPMQKQGKPKKQLMEEITKKDELEGFLWWAIEALKDVLNNDEFTYAPTTQEAREKWREYSVPLVKFIQTYVKQGTTRSQAEREADENDSVTSYSYDYVRKDFLETLIGDYCEARSHSRPSKKAITKELEKEFYVGTKSRTRKEPDQEQVPVYSGIELEYPDPEKCAGVQTYSETFTRTCAHTRVESSEQSVHTITSSLLNKVKEKVGDSAVEVQELVEELDENPDRVEEVLEELKSDGELFEPQPGEVKAV